MAGNTVYLNGLNELNCCLENSNEAALPINGLGEAFQLANNIKKMAAVGANTTPAKQALTQEIKKAADKIIGKMPVIPMVNPNTVNLNQPKPAVVNTAVTNFKRAVIEQKQTCKTNCATPSRVMPGIDVKVGSQTGAPPKKQLRKFNAQELNVMTRVIVEPMRKSLEATLQNLNQYPAQNAVYYNVPAYKAFITELLQNWSNPVAVKTIIAKYKGKINNTPVLNKMAMVAGLSGYGLNGLFDFVGDVADSIGDNFRKAANWAGNMTSNIYESLKKGVDVTFDMINKAGAAIGEGIKNAAIWTVGMLQKYNPFMIIARQAFRGLVAVNFRGWASDMQGMRDRGEGDKLKDVWTGTLVGGNWGDLISSINTGAGRDMKKAETQTVNLTAETIDTIEPFDWVSSQKDGLGFHTVAKHTLKAGDEININVLVGDKSYNGVHKVKYIGDDEGKQKDNFFVINILKKGGASGTFQFANEFSRMNDLWRVGIDPNNVQKGVIDVLPNQPKPETGTVVMPVIPNFKPIALPNAPKPVVPVVTPKPPQTVSTVIMPNGKGVTIKRDNVITPVNTPINTSAIKPNVIATPASPVKKSFFANMAAKSNAANNTPKISFLGLGSLGAEPVTIASALAAATPIITIVTAVITGKAPENTGNKDIDDASAAFNKAKKLKEEAEALLNQGKAAIAPFIPGSNNGGGSSVPKGINPQLPGPPNNNFPQPATPSNPSGSNNANNGGGNSKILLIGGAIAAVVVFALLSNKSNAAPKSNLNGLATKKTVGERSQTAKTKTVNNFKL